jgi:hypothetical protein
MSLVRDSPGPLQSASPSRSALNMRVGVAREGSQWLPRPKIAMGSLPRQFLLARPTGSFTAPRCLLPRR